jgi:hypothetical protein
MLVRNGIAGAARRIMRFLPIIAEWGWYEYIWVGNTEFRFVWEWGADVKTLVVNAPVSCVDTWLGIVGTASGGWGSGRRELYVGACDGSFLASNADAWARTNTAPLNLNLSVQGKKQEDGYNGDIGCVLWVSGVWTEENVKSWLNEPYGWTKPAYQIRPRPQACMKADLDLETRMEADADLDIWTAADADIEPAMDADTDLGGRMEADGDLQSAMEADADLCPEEDLT